MVLQLPRFTALKRMLQAISPTTVSDLADYADNQTERHLVAKVLLQQNLAGRKRQTGRYTSAHMLENHVNALYFKPSELREDLCLAAGFAG